MPTLFRKTAQLAGEIRFAAADAITHTLRVIVGTAPKSSGKVALTNVRAEFIELYPMPVTQGTESGTDVVSVRTVVSGSTLSEENIKVALAQHQANVASAVANDVLKGFVPDIQFTVKP